MINRNRGVDCQIPVGVQWDIIKAATKFRGIVLTVCKDECCYFPGMFQLRCWRNDAPRWANKGHIDGGDCAIFEVMMESPLAEAEDSWRDQLFAFGIDVRDCHLGKWERELCVGRDDSRYYNISIRLG